MKLEARAGGFSLVAYTDGYPEWVKLKVEGEEVERSIHPDDLPDLEYAARRLREKIAEAKQR